MPQFIATDPMIEPGDEHWRWLDQFAITYKGEKRYPDFAVANLFGCTTNSIRRSIRQRAARLALHGEVLAVAPLLRSDFDQVGMAIARPRYRHAYLLKRGHVIELSRKLRSAVAMDLQLYVNAVVHGLLSGELASPNAKMTMATQDMREWFHQFRR
jgi:hypothetical protein